MAGSFNEARIPWLTFLAWFVVTVVVLEGGFFGWAAQQTTAFERPDPATTHLRARALQRDKAKAAADWPG